MKQLIWENICKHGKGKETGSIQHGFVMVEIVLNQQQTSTMR